MDQEFTGKIYETLIIFLSLNTHNQIKGAKKSTRNRVGVEVLLTILKGK